MRNYTYCEALEERIWLKQQGGKAKADLSMDFQYLSWSLHFNCFFYRLSSNFSMKIHFETRDSSQISKKVESFSKSLPFSLVF